jgi:hypothetical protein
VKLFLAALVVLVALTAGSSTATARSEYRYPAAFERNFLANCNRTSHGQLAACRCALRWIERRYAYNEIVSYYLYDQPRMLRIVRRAALACRH